MIIEEAYIQITPHRWPQPSDMLKIEVRVAANGLRTEPFFKLIRKDDLESKFDIFWKFSGEELKAALKRAEERGQNEKETT